MKTGRDDYDHLIHMSRIPADEPTFILRAQDENAPDTVRDYAARAHTNGASDALVELALQRADAMRQWPVKKTPDVSDLTPDIQKHLAWLLSRRQWENRIDYGPSHLDQLTRAMLSLTTDDKLELLGRLRENLFPPLADNLRVWKLFEHEPISGIRVRG